MNDGTEDPPTPENIAAWYPNVTGVPKNVQQHYVNRILEWCPSKPTLQQPISTLSEDIDHDDPGDNKFRSTSHDQFYDRHLADSLVAKDVVYCAGLLDCITSVVQSYKDRMDASGWPDHLANLTDPQALKMSKYGTNHKVMSEIGISAFYSSHAVKHCLPVALTFVLHPQFWFPSILEWSTEGVRTQWALANGFLNFRYPSSEVLLHNIHLQRIIQSLDERTNDLLKLIDAKFNPAAIWEFKSMADGNDTAMEEIVRMGKKESGSFGWLFCSDFYKPNSTTKVLKGANLNDETKNRGAYRERAEMDALNPPWKDTISTTRPDIQGAHNPLSTGSKRQRSDSPSYSLRSAARLSNESMNAGHFLSQPGLAALPSLALDHRDLNGDGNDGTPQKPQKEVMAQSFIQQAWADAVRNKCSVVVIHAGNNEIIGIRHRASQTLYITDLIHPHDPPNGLTYGQIQTGLYICAALDVLDRAEQLMSNGKNKGDKSGQKGNPLTCDDGTADSSSYLKDGRSRSSDEGPQGNSFDMTVSLLKTAMSKNLLFLYFRYGIYNSAVPASFLRIGHEHPSNPDRNRKSKSPVLPSDQLPERMPRTLPPSEESANVILTSEYGPQSAGIVHVGVMEIDDSASPIPVVAKIAFSSEEKYALLCEHELYTLLHQNGVQGIPKDIGLFVDLDAYGEEGSEGPYALVLSYAGRSLCGRAHTVSRKTKLSLIRTLDSMHSLDILHGDIRGVNMCMSDIGEAFLIDLSHALTTKGKKAKREEIEVLCDLLQIGPEEALVAVRGSKLHFKEVLTRGSGLHHEISTKEGDQTERLDS